MIVIQLCPTLCDPVGCSPSDFLSMEFSRQEYWSGLLSLYPVSKYLPTKFWEVTCHKVLMKREKE